MAQDRFQLMADHSPVLLWMAGTDARCTFFNSTWLAFRGRSLEQELGFGWSEGIHPEDFESCMNIYTDAFNARREFEMEYRMQRADGAYRWILDRGTPRYESDRAFSGYVGSCVDITEIKEGSVLAEKSGRAVAKANEQIERFLFAASHDLSEPVRMVATYAGLLHSEQADRLDPEGQQFLSFVLEGALRLRQMVEGLSTVLTVRRSMPKIERLELRQIVELAEKSLRLALNESQGRIEIGGDGSAFAGDAQMLARVMQNLFSNALKFRTEALPKIRVSSERRGDSVVISVEDNGIGFDSPHAQRIFEMFQRLVSRDYEGSGLGLAICREIVELHGGTIWAMSRAGEGATFSFSVPAWSGESI